MHSDDRSNPGRDPRSNVTSEEIVRQFINDLQKGEFPCPETIAAQYPALMPALLQDLRIALSIHSAREEAARDEMPCEEAHEFDQEIAKLQKELPGFSLLCRLEHGGQGAVYKAIQTSTGRTVALKILLDVPIFAGHRRERFEREIELVSRLQHPNIVTIFESGVILDRPFYAMEYIDGLPIDDYILANRPSAEEAARIFSLITRAVSHAHKRGIIHRDLKPLNILVDLDGQPHVLDFGLAKELEAESNSNGGISITGQVVGTLPYLSPEQASGDTDEVDTRSDIYSLGVIFYRLLTGTYPYVVEGDPNIVRANILSSEPKSFRKILGGTESAIRSSSNLAHDDIERIVLKSLSKDRERRYQSADALADDLDRFARGEAVWAKADSTIYVLRKALRKYRLQVAFAAILITVLAVSSVATTIQWRHAVHERDNARKVAGLAHEILNDIVGKIENQISMLAGGVKVRDDILLGISNQLERLKTLVESDKSLLPILAQMREKQGDIANTIGKFDDARAAYEDFLKLNLQFSNNSSGSTFVPSIVRAYRKLALLPGENNQDQLFQRAIDITSKESRTNSMSDAMQYEASNLIIEYAQFLFNRGRVEDASVQLLNARPFILKSERQVSASIEWRELASIYYSLLGRTLAENGDANGSLENLIHCMKIRRELSAENPTNIVLRDKFRLAQINLSHEYHLMSRFEDAIELLKSAAVTGNYLWLTEPDSLKWKTELFRTYEKLTLVYLDSKEVNEAEESCKEIMKILASLESSGALVARPFQVIAYNLMGKVYIARQQWAEAESDLENALDNQEILASEETNSYAKRDLALILDSLGKCHRYLENLEASLDCYTRAYEIRKQRAIKHPEILDVQLDMVVSLTNLASWELCIKKEAADQRANRLLRQAAGKLEDLRINGMIDDNDKRFCEFSSGIATNQQLIKKRTDRRLKNVSATNQEIVNKKFHTNP